MEYLIRTEVLAIPMLTPDPLKVPFSFPDQKNNSITHQPVITAKTHSIESTDKWTIIIIII